MPITIQLTDDDLRIADVLGNEEAAKFAAKRGHYGDNDLERHIIGKRGELAVERWLRRHPIYFDPLFRHVAGDLANPDIRVVAPKGNFGIEVKTWREHNWRDLGRCISPTQRDDLLDRSDAVMWCTVLERKAPPRTGAMSFTEATVGELEITAVVRIEGWSSKEFVEKAPEVETRGKKNFQVPQDRVTDLPELLTFFGL